jgi:PHD/YefM family antitoxin component YafN of YafNO toxin-antitoxin module
MNVQYITNSKGKPSGVFIPIEDWELIKKELESKILVVPEWHKEILETRLDRFNKGKTISKDIEVALKELEGDL